MTIEEHKVEVEKLKSLEDKLVNLICLTEDDKLYQAFLKWTNQRMKCNQGFISVVEENL